MAIVFDTQAELEAFCEMFELKSVEPTKQSRKFYRKPNHIEQTAEIVEQEELNQPVQLVSMNEPEAVALPEEFLAETLEEPPILLASAS